MTRRSSTLLLLSLLAVGGCDRGGGTGSEDGGEYRAVLESPHGAEGAAAIELTGPGILSVTTSGTGRLWTQSAGETTRVVIVYEPAAPIEFRVTMADGQAPPATRVVEVADGGDQPRPSLDGYHVTFGR